jgi:hypothetical protein
MERAVMHSRFRESRLLGTVLSILLITGCAVDVQDGVGPRAPVPDVEGMALRGTSPAVRVDVELVDVPRDTTLFESKSTIRGSFGFAGVAPGLWQVRVESNLPEDFDSVSRQFYRSDSHGWFFAGTFDIFAYGAGPRLPVEDARIPVPTPFDPLDFRWTNPTTPGVVATVQVFDEARRDVWRSGRVIGDSARWNGYGSEGQYQGVQIGPGVYQWRMRFEFPDTAIARTQRRMLYLE